MSAPMPPIRGILLDIDGVLHVGMRPIPGAADTMHWLEQQGYHTCFVTNTTTMARATLAQRLSTIGLPIAEERLITAPDFAGIELVESQADVVVIGGAEELLTYEAMNAAFRMLMGGAVLLAMHTNLYWLTSEGLRLDSGPYVHALELATGKQAIVLGKPNRAFFEQALLSIGATAAEAVMVGDDLENDVHAAQQAGLRGVLVCTGKHGADSPLLERIHPDAILPSIAALPGWLAQ